ncbi:TolC family protein [Gaoshiqia sp. Z1-71]|uniref:TolC family protein n=1 Tax=Gaoshiqia hydrogeniformans TaxID=3290090 RepID=UPI003BF8910E
MQMKYLSLLILAVLLSVSSYSQSEKLKLTLEDVIEMASESSIDAFRIDNMYRASYWEFRYYKADKLPSLNLDATPVVFNRYRTREYNFQTNEEEYVQREYLNSDFSLSLNQNVALTGGSLFLQSQLGMVKNLGDSRNNSYQSTPISIGYTQSLNGYNQLKWKSRIEPLKFEKAKKNLIESREALSIKAVGKFFNLVDAQIQLNIAENNLASADTLYRLGQGRFQVGTITQGELLNMELILLNSKQSLNAAKSEVQRTQADLNSFLGLEKTTLVDCVVPADIPGIEVKAGLAIDKALENNPIVIGHRQQLLEQDENVARAKSEAGLNTSIFALYGLDQSAPEFSDVYKNPDNSQRFRLGVSVPIVDWGRRKGRYQMAEYNREVVKATIEQGRIDFEQELFQDVIEFNLQAEQVKNAGLADTVARKGYEVTLQRFLIGKGDVTTLNIARNDLETARRSYINAVRRYWNYYYTLRMKTLFDFVKNESLSVEYDKLLEK